MRWVWGRVSEYQHPQHQKYILFLTGELGWEYQPPTTTPALNIEENLLKKSN
jgi:hypothetical protein